MEQKKKLSHRIELDDLDLWEMINQVYYLLSRHRTTELKPVNVSRHQVLILWLIHHLGDKSTIAELSSATYLRAHTVFAIVGRMEKLGLLARDNIPGRKRIIVKLTEKGLEAYRYSIKAESIHTVMSALTAEQRQQLRTCLDTLLTNVKKEIALSEFHFYKTSEFLPLSKDVA